jgi:hypothetical protein
VVTLLVKPVEMGPLVIEPERLVPVVATEAVWVAANIPPVPDWAAAATIQFDPPIPGMFAAALGGSRWSLQSSAHASATTTARRNGDTQSAVQLAHRTRRSTRARVEAECGADAIARPPVV